MALQRPQTIKQVRSFIGAVTYYRDMYPRRSDILAPLTAMIGKRSLKWTSDCQKAFDQMKALMARDAFLKYPDHNKPFHIYCDASDLQLGSVIIQDGQPVAFYSRKLNAAQRNYTVGEKELLSVVETLKEYQTMLYGCPNITVYTDHRNNTFANLQTQRVLRWRLFLEDYGVKFEYIKGESNSLADALSCLPFDERQNPRGSSRHSDSFSPVDCYTVNDTLHAFHSSVDDSDLLDLFIYLPPAEHAQFVLDYPTIANAQAGDAQLPLDRQATPLLYQQRLMAPGINIWCHRSAVDKPWKVYLPQSLLARVIRWYHLALSHLGPRRLHETMSMVFYHPQLRSRIEAVLRPCRHCQMFKNV